MPPPLTSEALASFVAVWRAGGFAAAADRLHRSQPAISRRIAQAEAAAGAPLFERGPGGIRLTAAGRALLPLAERALAAIEDCERALAEVTEGAAPPVPGAARRGAARGPGGGPVSLAAVGTLAGGPLTTALARFAAAHPRAELRLETAASAEVARRVALGEADLGLRYGRSLDPALDFRRLGEERMAVAAAPAHRAAHSKTLGLEDLAGETWLAFPASSPDPDPSPATIRAQLALRGIEGAEIRAVDSLTAQKRLVEAGFGLALLPLGAMAEELARGGLVALPVADLAAANPVFLVSRRGAWRSPAAQGLLDALAEVDWNAGGPAAQAK